MMIKHVGDKGGFFNSLAAGALFRCGGEYYIKLRVPLLGSKYAGRNAVSLCSGSLCLFSPDSDDPHQIPVHAVEGWVTVKDDPC